MKYLMGVDEGTTGCKAILFDQEGTQIAATSREYPSYYPNPGWVEQDIEEIKAAVFACIRETIVKSKVDSADIVGISHSNQGITMVLLDENEELVFDHTIGWQDLRYTEMLPELRQEVDLDEYNIYWGGCPVQPGKEYTYKVTALLSNGQTYEVAKFPFKA